MLTYIVLVQLPSHIWLFRLHRLQHTRPPCPSPSPPWQFAQVHVHCISDAIQPSHPLTPSSPSALNLSQHQGLFQWVICSHQMTKILELSFSISPSSEYSGLISLKTDWFDLLAVQGTFRSLLQHDSLKASVLCPAAFVMVQLSQSYVTTGKTIALTIWTFVSRVISLLFCIVHAQKLCRSCYSPDTSLALFSKCGSERNSISITWKCVLKTYPRLTECETQKVGFSSMYVAIPICTWYTAQFMKHCSGSFGGHSSVNGGRARLSQG